MTWKKGAIFGEGKKYIGVDFINSDYGHLEAVAIREDGTMEHWWRDKKGKWHMSAIISNGTTGSPGFLQGHSGRNFEVLAPMSEGGIRHFWRYNPDTIPEKKSRLKVKNKRLYFRNDGTVPFIGIGVSPRPLLHSRAGDWDPLPWKYDEYIRRFIASGINKVRIDAHKDYSLTADFCQIMEENEIVVELTLADGDRPNFGDHKQHIRMIQKCKNIIAECWNELNKKAWISKALEIALDAVKEGLIVSGGGWGWSAEGQQAAAEFMKKFPGQICVQHRPYPPLSYWQESIADAVEKGFIVSCNELNLDPPYPAGAPANELIKYIRGAINAGASAVDVYLGCEKHIEAIGKLCKEFNPI